MSHRSSVKVGILYLNVSQWCLYDFSFVKSHQTVYLKRQFLPSANNI